MAALELPGWGECVNHMIHLVAKFHLDSFRSTLERPLIAMEIQETSDLSRRAGVEGSGEISVIGNSF